jgi:hypothetical protein
MSVRVIAGVFILAAIVVGLVGIGSLAYLAHGLPPVRSSPDRGAASDLIGGPVGFQLTVGDVRLPAAGGMVTMTVSFHNTSAAQQRADPQDFTLREGTGAAAGPTFDATCPRWTRADLHPTGGAAAPPRDADARQVGVSFGPVPLCFAVAHPASGGLTLIWNPDVGLLGSPIAVPLR